MGRIKNAAALNAIASPEARAPEHAPPAQSARIVKRAPYEDPKHKSARERALAGTYRVIHGTVIVPKPESDRRNSDGSINAQSSLHDYARLGDEVWLNDEDAARMLDADLVERLDTKPSRVGKVWDPPRTSSRMPA